MSFTFDIATYPELRRANKSKDPSNFQLNKLPYASLQLSQNSEEQNVYLFPYNPLSKYRKLEIVGNEVFFSYEVKTMPNAPANNVYQHVYADVGTKIFTESNLSAAFDNVQLTMEQWLQGIEEKRVGRGSGDAGGSNNGSEGGGVSDSSVPPPTLGSAAEDCASRQQAILDQIQKQRDEFLLKQRG